MLVLSCLAGAGVRGQADDWKKDLEEERLTQSGAVITIVFDDSGSMNERNKLAMAKDAFRSWLATVPENHRLALVGLNGGGLVKWGRGNREELIAAVEKLQASGGTPLVATLEKVLDQIEKRRDAVGPYERHIVVVFTDGKESTPKGNRGVQEVIAQLAARSIETVGIGFQGEGDYMNGHATRYFNAQDSEELRRGLEQVDIEIGSPDDIKITPEILEAMKQMSAIDPGLFPKFPDKESSPDGAGPSVPPAQAVASAPGDWVVFSVVILILAVFGSKVLNAFKAGQSSKSGR